MYSDGSYVILSIIFRNHAGQPVRRTARFFELLSSFLCEYPLYARENRHFFKKQKTARRACGTPRSHSRNRVCDYLLCSHFWFATVQEVLQADWQEVWHSPQPPCIAVCFRVAEVKVLMCFMEFSSIPKIFDVFSGACLRRGCRRPAKTLHKRQN